MADIPAISVPIFLIIGIGYAAVRLGLFARGDMRILGFFVLNVAMPALIVRALVQKPLGDVLDGRYLAGYALASLTVFAVVFLTADRLTASGRARSALQALGAATSNTGFIGYPVAAMAFGPTAAVAMAHNFVIENLLILPLGLALAESGRHAGKSGREVALETLRGLGRNPLLLALILGAMLAAFGVTLPLPFARTIDLLANASAPVSLFVIGGTLVGVRLGGMAKAVSLVVIGKLALHPLAVLAVAMLLPARDPVLVQAMVIFASVPMVTIYPLLGQRYGEEEFCAAALLVTTTLSFLTISAALLFIR